MSIGLRESPPCTRLPLAPGGESPWRAEYRSVPGRGVSDKRRLDVSSGLDVVVEFYRLKPVHGGIDRILLGTFALDGGVPLIWPVPDSAHYDDVLVVIEAYESQGAGFAYIGDHWSTT